MKSHVLLACCQQIVCFRLVHCVPSSKRHLENLNPLYLASQILFIRLGSQALCKPFYQKNNTEFQFIARANRAQGSRCTAASVEVLFLGQDSLIETNPLSAGFEFWFNFSLTNHHKIPVCPAIYPKLEWGEKDDSYVFYQHVNEFNG